MSTPTLDHIPVAPPEDRPFDPPAELTGLLQDNALCQVVTADGEKLYVALSQEMCRGVLSDARFSADVTRSGFPLSGHIGGVVDVFAKSMLRLDDPDHSRLRSMVASEFRPRRVQAFLPSINEVVNECRARLKLAGSGADIVPMFSSEIPSVVISRLLGLPEAKRPQIKAIANSVNEPHAANSSPSDHPLALLAQILREIIDGGELEPGLLMNMRGHIDSGGLTMDELVSMAVLLTFGGHETTANTLVLGAALVIPQVELMARVTANPELISPLVEEVLRIVSVTRSGPRRMATEDVEVAGHQFKAGDGVLLGLNAANRDARIFERPNEIDLDRGKDQKHLTFSAGLHLCLGQFLAREELIVGFRALFEGFNGLALPVPSEDLQYKGASSIYSLVSLPVTWTSTTF